VNNYVRICQMAYSYVRWCVRCKWAEHLSAAMGLIHTKELLMALDREPTRPRLPMCDHLPREKDMYEHQHAAVHYFLNIKYLHCTKWRFFWIPKHRHKYHKRTGKRCVRVLMSLDRENSRDHASRCAITYSERDRSIPPKRDRLIPLKMH